MIDDVVEGGEHPSQEQFVGLPTGWPPPGVEGARELVFDLFSGQSRELAGIALLEPGVDDHRTDADRCGDDGGRVWGSLEIAGEDGVERTGVSGGGAGLRPTEVGEWWVGLALPPPGGIPFRLAVPGEQQIEHLRRKVTSNADECGDAPLWKAATVRPSGEV